MKEQVLLLRIFCNSPCGRAEPPMDRAIRGQVAELADALGLGPSS